MSSLWMLICFSDHFSSMCTAQREERAGLSCWIGTLDPLPMETQHSRPLRPRMPNTQQYIFLQFCGFSAWQCDINSCRFQHEAIKKSHNSLRAAGHLVYPERRDGNLLWLLHSFNHLNTTADVVVANFLTSWIDFSLSEMAYRPPLDVQESNSNEWRGLLTSERLCACG